MIFTNSSCFPSLPIVEMEDSYNVFVLQSLISTLVDTRKSNHALALDSLQSFSHFSSLMIANSSAYAGFCKAVIGRSSA